MNMTDYLLTTSVTAEALSPVFEEAVRVTCCKDYTPGQVEAWVQRATSSRWQELLSGDLHFLAAVSQPSGEVAGFISVRGDGYLHSLFVHPAHQRRGVASFLLRAAEEEARRSTMVPAATVSLPMLHNTIASFSEIPYVVIS